MLSYLPFSDLKRQLADFVTSFGPKHLGYRECGGLEASRVVRRGVDDLVKSVVGN